MEESEAAGATTTGASKEWWPPYITYYGSEKPSHFAEALAMTIPPDPEGKTKLLDIGCGCGIIGIYRLIEKKAQFVTFTDLRDEWITITGQNVAIKINERIIRPSQISITPKAGSFTENISADMLTQHDLLAFNPPQYPSKYADKDAVREIESNEVKRAYRKGGLDGLDVAREFFAWYESRKPPKPEAIILLSSFIGRQLINDAIAAHGLHGEIFRETPAGLRKEFWKQAEAFSTSPAEMRDRSIVRDGEGWKKRLLTIRLKN